MKRIAISFFLILIIGHLAFSGCASKGTPLPSVVPEPAALQVQVPDAQDSESLRKAFSEMTIEVKQARRTYLIGPGDVLLVNVWMRKDLSKQGAVRDDGAFFVPLAGNLQAQGKTVSEFQKLLTEKLGEYLRSPQIDVEILEYNSKFYYLVGQVREPGHYPITATTTLMEAIGTGKGFTDKAGLGEAYLIHGGKIVPVDFLALFERGKMENNVHLDDGDVIYVPSIDYARVYVLGEVLRPMAVPVRTGRISLAEAIAEAGGFNETTAYKSQIKIIRGGMADAQVFTVNFNDMVKGKVPDYAMLKPGDIVYVPSSGLAKWDRVMGLIMPSLSRIIIDAAAINAMTNN